MRALIRRNSPIRIAAAAAVAVPLVFAGASAASASGTSVHGCPHGDVCLYKYDNFRGTRGYNRPDAEFFTYGVHQIYGFTAQAGSTVDNQWGYYNPHDSYQYFGAACYYRYSNGTGFYTSDRGFPAQTDAHFDLLPINSVQLVKITAKNEYNWCHN